MKAIDRLEQLLNEKDIRIDELEEELRRIKDYECMRWVQHSEIEKDEPEGLPVPRLEMRWTPADRDGKWYSRTATYSLVYRHFLGHIVVVPLGSTLVRGGNDNKPPSLEDLPFRDGAHIRHDAKQLGLPAFIVVENRWAPIKDEEP